MPYYSESRKAWIVEWFEANADPLHSDPQNMEFSTELGARVFAHVMRNYSGRT